MISQLDLILEVMLKDLNSLKYGNFKVDLPAVELCKMTVLLWRVVCFGLVRNKRKR
jgi:hypothetical protein